MSERENELTPLATWSLRFIGAALLVVVVFFTQQKWHWIPTPKFMQSKVIESSAQLAVNNDPVAASLTENVKKLPLPSKRPAVVQGPEIRFERWFWNAHMPCDLAVGGKTPTEGSLMAKYGVNLKMVWNDVTPKMQENIAAFATALASGDPQPTVGAHFVSVMGDQGEGFLGPLNKQLSRLGKDYVAEVFYSCGRSNGEDAFMGPASWKSNPQNAIGGMVSAVITEGDWNIVIKWARDNNIPVNPDEKVYDPQALNFHNPADYMAAAEDYILNKCEDLPVVSKGKKTGETKNVCIDAVSTWTPADVNVATKRGGLVRIVSTKEYSGQMPNIVIGIRKWNRDNREAVVNMIRAFGEAGDQVLAHSDALYRAAEASAEIYDNSQTPAWIVKYYKGVTERDAQKTLVDLGGSRAHNLADNLRWFGVSNSGSNMFCASYTVFGNIVHELYPERLSDRAPCKDILNTEYLREAAQKSTVTLAEAPTFSGGAVRDVISTQRVYITFQVGSAELTPTAERQLNDILQNLQISNDLAIELSGHTDNTGTVSGNQALSEARAFAVKRWLQKSSPTDFPERRFSKVVGEGQDRPAEPNSTSAGREKNRRVEIVLGRQE